MPQGHSLARCQSGREPTHQSPWQRWGCRTAPTLQSPGGSESPARPCLGQMPPRGEQAPPGAGSWWWHQGPAGLHHPIPTSQGRGVSTSLQLLARVAQIPPHSWFPPGCESHCPVQEPLHLKGHRALMSVAWDGRGGFTPCWHFWFPACHPCKPCACTVAWEQRDCPYTQRWGKPPGLPRTPRGHSPSKSPRPIKGAALAKQEGSLPMEGTPQRDEGSWHHRGFFVNFYFIPILKKICNDFPGNKSLTCSCQWTEVENGL